MNRTGTYIGDNTSRNLASKTVRYSLAIVEQYTSGKSTIRTAAQSPVLFKAGTLPTGWFTGTLTFTNCNDSTSTKTQANGGTWRQTDTSGNATVPFPAEYC
jgi:N-acetylmuramoyl-L-alanine amidase CwlA